MIYLSPSKLATIDKCSLAYWFDRTKAKPLLPNLPIINGRAIDKAIGASWENKIKTGEDLPFRRIQEYYMSSMESSLPKTRLTPGVDDPKATMVTSIMSMKQYYDLYMPDIHPINIQSRVKIQVSEDIIIRGNLDCETEISIRDLKSTSKPIYPDKAKNYQNQLTIYNSSGKKKLYIDAVLTRGPGKAEIIEMEHNQEQAMAAINKAADIIRNESYKPNRESPLCTRRWCPHWQNCEELVGGTVKP